MANDSDKQKVTLMYIHWTVEWICSPRSGCVLLRLFASLPNHFNWDLMLLCLLWQSLWTPYFLVVTVTLEAPTTLKPSSPQNAECTQLLAMCSQIMENSLPSGEKQCDAYFAQLSSNVFDFLAGVATCQRGFMFSSHCMCLDWFCLVKWKTQVGVRLESIVINSSWYPVW